MQIGDPLRIVIVEPLELPVEEPATAQPEPEPVEPQPDPDEIPAAP